MPYSHEYQLANNPNYKQPKFKKPIPSRVNLLLGIIGLLFLASVIAVAVNHHHIYSFILPGGGSSLNTSALQSSADKLFEEEPIKVETLYEKNFKASLNQSEKDLIHTLRLEVQDTVTHDFMKTDSYLIKWLNARDWNVESAKEMLMEHLDWRVEYNIDKVLTDNLTYFENEYPFYLDGFDYNGAPVGSMNAGDWDLRKIAATGQSHEFLRYAFSRMEKAIKYTTDCQAKGATFSKGVLIMNLATFTLSKQGCFTCLPILVKFIFGLDDNYPGWLSNFLLINTPDIADMMLDLLVPYLSGENKEAYKAYGFNKTEWQSKILSLIPADQIRPEFGGTKVDFDL